MSKTYIKNILYISGFVFTLSYLNNSLAYSYNIYIYQYIIHIVRVEPRQLELREVEFPANSN